MSWIDLPARRDRTGVLVSMAAAIVSGACWVLASPPHGLWPLGWLAALPLAWVIDRAPTARRAGLWGGLAAAVFTVGGFSWMIYLLEVNAHLPTPLAVLGLGLLAGYHGLVFLIGARLTRGLRDRRRARADLGVIEGAAPWPMALCLPLGFVVVEIVLPTPFPFSLALTQAEVGPIRMLSAFAGTAGIVALITGLGGAVYDALTRTARRWQPAAGVAVFAIVAIVGSHRTVGDGPSRTVKIGIVQPNDPVSVRHSSRDRVAHLHALQRATRALEDAGAELVVWSETAYPFSVPRDLTADVAKNNPLSLRGNTTGPILLGAPTVDDAGQVWNSAILVGPDGRFLGRSDKIHRMVGSEYNPLVERFPWLEKYLPDGAGNYQGGDQPTILRWQDLDIAVMVCLEDVVPSFGRELTALEPNLIVNLTNDTWFDIHAEPLEHEALARYRTIEVGVPMIRAVNTGPSSHVDRDGRVVARTAVRRSGAPETLLATVTIGPRAHSLYAAIGGWLTWLVSLGALGWWLVPGVVARARKKRR